jgi:hypothetical protein
MNAPNKQALLLQAGLPLRLVGWDAMSVGIRVIFSILADLASQSSKPA